MTKNKKLIVKNFSKSDYNVIFDLMKKHNKNDDMDDELWLVEHYPVYTLGSQGGKENIIKNIYNIPIVQTDRGGNITYHGPGQLVIYPLWSVREYRKNLLSFINLLEKSFLDWIKISINQAKTEDGMRGIFIDNKKLASIGLRIANGKTYHGISVNINTNLLHFKQINPCGYKNLEMTNWLDYADYPHDAKDQLIDILKTNFNYARESYNG